MVEKGRGDGGEHLSTAVRRAVTYYASSGVGRVGEVGYWVGVVRWSIDGVGRLVGCGYARAESCVGRCGEKYRDCKMCRGVVRW